MVSRCPCFLWFHKQRTNEQAFAVRSLRKQCALLEIENKLISGTWTKNTCRFLVVFGSYGFRRNYYFWHRKETDTDHVFLTHQSFQILMTDCKALWVWKIFNFGNILHCIDFECVMSSLKDSHNSFSGFPLMIPSTYEIIFFILNLFQPFYYRNFFDHAVQYLLHLHVHRVLHVYLTPLTIVLVFYLEYMYYFL